MKSCLSYKYNLKSGKHSTSNLASDGHSMLPIVSPHVPQTEEQEYLPSKLCLLDPSKESVFWGFLKPCANDLTFGLTFDLTFIMTSVHTSLTFYLTFSKTLHLCSDRFNLRGTTTLISTRFYASLQSQLRKEKIVTALCVLELMEDIDNKTEKK